MTIIIEDGSLVAGANSYVGVSEFTLYLDARAYTVTAEKEPFLIRSFDYMSTLVWVDSHDEAYTVTSKMKDAQCEIAYRMSLGLDPSASPEDSVKRKKVDVLETEYFSSNAGKSGVKFLDYIPYAKLLLSGLIVTLENRIVKI